MGDERCDRKGVSGLFGSEGGRSTKKLRECLGRLSEEQVWARGAEHENAIGNLLLHPSGNMRQWIMHGVGQQPDVRTRDAEFAATGGMGKAELMALWTATLTEAREIIRTTPMERLTEITRPQKGYEVTVLGAIYRWSSTCQVMWDRLFC